MTIVLGSPRVDPERYRVLLSSDAEVVTSAQALHSFLDDHPDELLAVIAPEVTMPVASAVADRYRLNRPDLGIIMMRERIDTEIVTAALRSGIRDVVSIDDVEGITAAVRRSQNFSNQLRGAMGSTIDVEAGKVIMVFGAKGGCGKTTIATNLAESLAKLNRGRVCIVDLDLDFGDVAIFLKLDPAVTISRAVQFEGELDATHVRSLITPYAENLDALLAPAKPAEAEFITPDIAMNIIDVLRTMYSFIVLDTPPSFAEVTLRSFEKADSYILVTTLDLPSLKNIKVAMETLDALGYPRSRWHVVLNRAGSDVGLGQGDVEEVLGIPVTTAIPSSRDVPATLNTGTTLVADNPEHPVSKAIFALAITEAGAPVQREVSKPSLWAKFRRKS
ncbi:MAG: AAA family ATPase [Candidatus Nanopelagicales bacterium]